MNNAGFRKKFLDGVAQGAGLFFAVAFLSFAYAAASLGNLPSATGWTEITASAWNEMVSHINAIANGANVSGVYTFKVAGSTELFQGRGTYDSTAGTFSWEMICDPTTVNTYCWANGRARCGANTACAIGIAAYGGGTYSNWLIVGGSYYYRSGAGMADVLALPVNTVTKVY